MTDRSQIVNFGPGPSALPDAVLDEAAKGLLNYQGTGIGITELSHRSKEFGALVKRLESSIREQLNVPSSHSILFTQGGGSGQFSAVVLNLLARHRLLYPDLSNDDRVMDYVVTGSWSKKALEEAKRLGGGRVNVVVDGRQSSKDGKSFDNIPSYDRWSISPNPAFIYYCENETVDGVQFSSDPTSHQAFPHHLIHNPSTTCLVADFSSSFMSRPIPYLANHALIYAGAQKNIGPSGLTILIIRQDLLVDTDAAAKLGANPVPYTMAYKTLSDNNSLYNTPPMFSIYVAALVLEQLKAKGSLQYLEKVNREKAGLLYATLQEGERRGIVKIKVKEGSRSWMNVTFEILGGTEKEFLEGAEQRGFRQLKGHRSVGGIRVSLYNAITLEQVQRLAEYLHEFYESV
ncbi:hypothetical protein Clacol_006659 [Clathrus columnatus]|uniref:phosphoserine transaminase n=1 Tax=Clathrus columnatus TaxID=1419009 RepID=A0AAV5AFI3_9AGAM|nr:hypothetical protein Clacol_006659 [Clathrus columnatus]